MGPAVVLAVLATADLTPASLLVAPVPRGGRSMLRIDPVEHAVVTGEPGAPAPGKGFAGLEWKEVKPGEDGWFSGREFGSGYAAWTVETEEQRVLLLEAQGHSMVYVNGVPRTGDPYQFGYVSLPVRLNPGKNVLLFACGRGRFRAKLTEPDSEVSIDVRDATLPDVVEDSNGLLHAAVVVRNAARHGDADVTIVATSEDGASCTTYVGKVAQHGVRKVPIQVPERAGEVRLQAKWGARVLHTATVTLRRRGPHEARKVTFVSGIDGSVQYYGLLPSLTEGPGQALALTLHGASVEAIGQAEAYSPKSGTHIVAPTNRRPFGFDWEDVGRKDGIEVLEHARRLLETDPARTYVTGHSMGGHGAWMFGAQFPGKFAATAPCAGWQSFWTYGGGAPRDATGAVAQTLLRASNASLPLLLGHNYAHTSVYALHGDADTTVPVQEPRTMREELAKLGVGVDWHEEPGQGHWYDTDPGPGANCVDWPPIFDLFSRTRIPDPGTVHRLRFATVSPAIHSTTYWATIGQQEFPFLPSEVDLTARPQPREIAGTTKNVAHLEVRNDALFGDGAWSVNLDGTEFPGLEGRSAWFERSGGVWRVGKPLQGAFRSPERGAGIKEAFDRNVVLVYGTAGIQEQTDWSRERARFDAETFWYRGNSGCRVIADTEYEPTAAPDQNVVLYGDASMNRAYKALVGPTPIHPSQASLKVGGQVFTENGTGYAFLAPRIGSKVASVLVVGGLGRVGLRATDRMPFFLSGAGLPDYVVLTPLASKVGEPGVLAAGFFTNEGELEPRPPQSLSLSVR